MRGNTWQWLVLGRHGGGVYVPLLLPFVLASLTVVSPQARSAQSESDITEPKLLSIFPLAAQPGTTIQAEIRGNLLEGTHSVWFDAAGVKGRLLRVEVVKDVIKQMGKASEQESKGLPPVYRALIEMEIEPSARLGTHSLRLVSSRGVSNALRFCVINEPTVVETTGTHHNVKLARRVSLPVIVNGKLEKPGKLDYYSFRAGNGQKLYFEVQAENFNPRLALYRAGGSWLNPDRPTRLLLEENRSSDLMPVGSSGTYQVVQDGEYFLEISSLFGKGSPDACYQLRIAFRAEAAKSEIASEPHQRGWLERDFSRKLRDDWLMALQARGVNGTDQPTTRAKPAASAPGNGVGAGVEGAPPNALKVPAHLVTLTEREPNDHAYQALDAPIPSVIEGTIERPGDVDDFRFKVESGQKLVFEIETPEVKPPHFNPRLAVVDSHDRELFSNVQRRESLYNNNADRQVYLKSVEPKTTYTFERGGEYVLQLRDITSRYGRPGHRYRILVRPQIPHLGDVLVSEPDDIKSELDHINLIRGKAKKVTVTTAYEEGFTGDVAFVFTGLPEGVLAFPAAEANNERAPTEVTLSPEIVAPKTQKTTIVLVANPEAPVTQIPRVVQLHCQPVANGKLGSDLVVSGLLLMVVENYGQTPRKNGS